jgi:CheY-like chemotaxis protein
MPGKILVVDDEKHIVHVVTLKLRNAGYEVISAGDGEEGLEVATTEHPDLIVTDYQMPYMTGLEMSRALRADVRTANIPILMLTARGFSLSDEDLAAVNIKTSMSKPFSPRELIDSIERTLAA